MTQTNPNSAAREFALQFLYLCESDKLYYFSQDHFNLFCQYFQVDGVSRAYFESVVSGVFSKMTELDEQIGRHSKNWKLSRMAVTDRVVLRVACYEFLEELAPDKVVLNEAIELAKKFGTEHSGSFVNGVLDAILSEVKTRRKN